MGGTTEKQSTLGRIQRARLRYGWGFDKSDFEYYGLAERPESDATDYLGYHWYRYKIRPAMNSQWARSITEDKWVFYRLADSFGWPTPQTFGVYDPTYGTTRDLARPLRSVPELMAELDRVRPDGVVLKPNGGNQGQGVLVLESINYDSGDAVTRAGEAVRLERALAELDVAGGKGGYPGYIVQALV